MRRKGSRVTAVALFSCLLVCSGMRAQSTGQTPPDPLAGLKRALSAAGAPVLTAAQESQLNTLITARRAALPSPAPSTALQAAQLAYNDAILAGNYAAAQAQADLIANEQANAARTTLKDSAKFQIDVLNVLRTNDNQVGLLLARLGTNGLSRLLASLAGPGGFGGGPGGGRDGGRGVGRRDLPRNSEQ